MEAEREGRWEGEREGSGMKRKNFKNSLRSNCSS